jgi:hypothetical protein
MCLDCAEWLGYVRWIFVDVDPGMYYGFWMFGGILNQGRKYDSQLVKLKTRPFEVVSYSSALERPALKMIRHEPSLTSNGIDSVEYLPSDQLALDLFGWTMNEQEIQD